MVEPQTFFIVTQEVISHVKPNGHTCSMSPDLYCLFARIENSPHVRGRVEIEFHIDERRDLDEVYSPYCQLVLWSNLNFLY